MRVSHWLRPLAARLTRPRVRQAPQRPTFRPRVEGLEDRTVLSPTAVAPTLNAGSVNEGQTIALQGSFSDPDGSPWTVDVNWGDGTPDTIFMVASAGSLGTKPHTFGEEGTYTVKVTVTDNTNLSGSATFTVTVSDPAVVPAAVAPFTTCAGGPTLGTVATFTDPGGAEPNAFDGFDG